MRRKVVIFVILWIFYILQTTVFQLQTVTGVSPNLLLFLTVSLAFMQGKKEGLVVGFLSGLLIDLFYSRTLGFHALIYLLIGYGTGYFFHVFFDDDVKMPIILVAVTDFIYSMYIYVFGFLLRGRLEFGIYLTQIILPEIIYTVLITLIFYRLLFKINHALMDRQKEERQSLWIRD